MTRSKYLAAVVRADVLKGGPLVLDAPPAQPEPATTDFTEEVYDFLLYAIPALDDYERQQKKLPPAQNKPEPPDEIVETKLWRLFLFERDEILRYKWLESENLRYDIGLPRAIREWLQRHRPLWRPPATD